MGRLPYACLPACRLCQAESLAACWSNKGQPLQHRRNVAARPGGCPRGPTPTHPTPGPRAAGERLTDSRATDVRQLCDTLLSAYLIQLLDTGFLHADPHPGNLLRTPDGRVGILDHGLVTVGCGWWWWWVGGWWVGWGWGGG